MSKNIELGRQNDSNCLSTEESVRSRCNVSHTHVHNGRVGVSPLNRLGGTAVTWSYSQGPSLLQEQTHLVQNRLEPEFNTETWDHYSLNFQFDSLRLASEIVDSNMTMTDPEYLVRVEDFPDIHLGENGIPYSAVYFRGLKSCDLGHTLYSLPLLAADLDPTIGDLGYRLEIFGGPLDCQESMIYIDSTEVTDASHGNPTARHMMIHLAHHSPPDNTPFPTIRHGDNPQQDNSTKWTTLHSRQYGMAIIQHTTIQH